VRSVRIADDSVGGSRTHVAESGPFDKLRAGDGVPSFFSLVLRRVFRGMLGLMPKLG